jgi:hypothetical protein
MGPIRALGTTSLNVGIILAEQLRKVSEVLVDIEEASRWALGVDNGYSQSRTSPGRVSDLHRESHPLLRHGPSSVSDCLNRVLAEPNNWIGSHHKARILLTIFFRSDAELDEVGKWDRDLCISNRCIFGDLLGSVRLMYLKADAQDRTYKIGSET